jgi:hypothetical protein
MSTLTAETPTWMLVDLFILLGWANGLAQQIPVSAMSHIKQGEQQEVANGSTKGRGTSSVGTTGKRLSDTWKVT